MSFQLLKSEIIDQQLCQGCGLCAGICKSIDMKDLKPELTGTCILEKTGENCGKCYASCPQANQHIIIPTEPKAIYSIRQKENEQITTTLSKYLFKSKKITRLIKAENIDKKIQSISSYSEEDANEVKDIAHGRSEILMKLMEEYEVITQNSKEVIGIFGTPCEISGAAHISKEKQMSGNTIKIGTFCDLNIPNTQFNHGTIVSPCTSTCPAGVDASGYIKLIKHGKYQEAIDLIRQKNPLPSICGRICTHECENECTLISTGNPIAIRELKKYVTEWEIKKGLDKETNKISADAKKVAIIGSGPAGLSAAYYLAKMGYQPTIFEKSDKVGGMLRLGIPQFRLPDNVIDHDIEFIKRAGVKIIINKSVNAEFTFEDLRKEGFEAIFLAIGQYEPYKLGIPGEELNNVHTALDFVQKWKYSMKEAQEFKDKVVGIIGGGSVALDAAQTALRMGAKKVMVIYRRSENELPARREDYEHSKREGIEFLFLRNPTGFIPDENQTLKGAEVIEMELCDEDSSGRSRPQEIACSEYEIEKQHVVVAIGQGVECSEIYAASDGKLIKKRGKLEIDELTLQTSIPDVFSGGDMVVRSKNVAISAVAHGHQAAISIDRFLQGKDLKDGRYLQERMYSDGKFFTPDAYPEPAPLNEIELYLSTKEIESVFSSKYSHTESI